MKPNKFLIINKLIISIIISILLLIIVWNLYIKKDNFSLTSIQPTLPSNIKNEIMKRICNENSTTKPTDTPTSTGPSISTSNSTGRIPTSNLPPITTECNESIEKLFSDN